MVDHHINLGYTPYPWQAEFHVAKKHRSLLIVPRQHGKTWGAMAEIVHCALQHDPAQGFGRFGYIAKELKQARGIMWEHLKAFVSKIPGVQTNEQFLTVTLPNKAAIILYGIDNQEAIRGLNFYGLILDEYASFPAGAWDSILHATTVAHDAWVMFIGTPKGVDPLTVLYEKHRHDQTWYCRITNVHEAGVYSPEKIAQIKKDSLTPELFKLEWECDYFAGAVNQLIPGDVVTEAMKRPDPGIDLRSARIIGVDVARQGADSTAIAKRCGKVFAPTIMLKGMGVVEVAKRVADEVEAYQADAIFVDGTGGYGSGVVDVLRDMGVPCVEVAFNMKARDPRFLNARAEMYFDFSKWLLTGCLPESLPLRSELCVIRYESKDDGILRLKEKSEIKKELGGRSPDESDAMALTFFMPVVRRTNNGVTLKVKTEWLDWG